MKSLFGTSEETGIVETADEQADINIFTVASGLLYEVECHLFNVLYGTNEVTIKRFVGIMILSVLRNTKSTVKFWFIENFLSPSFLVCSVLLKPNFVHCADVAFTGIHPPSG